MSNINSTPTADPSAATGPNGSGNHIDVPTVVDGRYDAFIPPILVNGSGEDLRTTATVVNSNSNTNSSATVVRGSGKVALGVDRGAEFGFIDVAGADHDYVFNYLGSSGGMESDGLLMLFKKIHKERHRQLHYDTVIIDDGTRLKVVLTSGSKLLSVCPFLSTIRVDISQTLCVFFVLVFA